MKGEKEIELEQKSNVKEQFRTKHEQSSKTSADTLLEWLIYVTNQSNVSSKHVT